MSYLVGYTNDRSGADALALARMLAAGNDVELTVCVVVPETWGYPSPANVEAEYVAFLSAHANKALAKAKSIVGPDIRAEYVIRPARNGAIGLAAVAEDISADYIVLGSAREGPVLRCSLGSVAAGVLSLSDRPVIMAPRGFRPVAAGAVSRITCAFIDDGAGHRSLASAIELARQHAVPLRLVTFVVRDKQMYPAPVGFDSEAMVANAWRTQAEAAQARALAAMPDGLSVTATIGDGADWKKAIAAIEWLPGEILVAGSHHMGTVSGLLFGSAFTRLLRHATVPIVAVP